VRSGGVVVLVLLATLAIGGSLAGEGKAQSEGFAYSVEIEGDIDRGTSRELERALEDAARERARLVILRLDTPGGELDATRAMVSALLATPVPVVVHVAPDGARAASAGLFLTMAGDVAAMAPQTNIGSASPILIGPEGIVDAPVVYRKFLNDTAAYVRTLAEGVVFGVGLPGVIAIAMLGAGDRARRPSSRGSEATSPLTLTGPDPPTRSTHAGGRVAAPNARSSAATTRSPARPSP
jgi:membrane-bound serine protease (ClpP class)